MHQGDDRLAGRRARGSSKAAVGFDPRRTLPRERREKFDAAFRATTIEALLNHRAGLPHDGSFNGLPDEPVALQRLAYMDALLAKPPAFEAGSFHYSNAGYIIVGAVIERLTGKPWETAIRGKLFNPLGMKTAGFGCCSSSRNTTDG